MVVMDASLAGGVALNMPGAAFLAPALASGHGRQTSRRLLATHAAEAPSQSAVDGARLCSFRQALSAATEQLTAMLAEALLARPAAAAGTEPTDITLPAEVVSDSARATERALPVAAALPLAVAGVKRVRWVDEAAMGEAAMDGVAPPEAGVSKAAVPAPKPPALKCRPGGGTGRRRTHRTAFRTTAAKRKTARASPTAHAQAGAVEVRGLALQPPLTLYWARNAQADPLLSGPTSQDAIPRCPSSEVGGLSRGAASATPTALAEIVGTVSSSSWIDVDIVLRPAEQLAITHLDNPSDLDDEFAAFRAPSPVPAHERTFVYGEEVDDITVYFCV